VGVVAIVGAIALLSLAAPTAAARDGAELTAAAASLGIAHPTGFALEMVALRVAMVVPVGDVAFRANALTALFGALVLGLVARLVLDAAPLPHREPSVTEDERPATISFAAVCAPIALFASRTVMRGFTAVEVYASSLALSLAALGALRWLAPAAALRALALCAGLSCVTHTSVRAAILAAVLALWSSAPVARSFRARAMIAWLSLAAIALALVGYLIVAARREPWADWGGPDDLSGLWAHVSAARIRAAFSEQMGASGAAIDAAAAAGAVLWQDLGPVTLLASLAGALLALRDRAALSRALDGNARSPDALSHGGRALHTRRSRSDRLLGALVSNEDGAPRHARSARLAVGSVPHGLVLLGRARGMDRGRSVRRPWSDRSASPSGRRLVRVRRAMRRLALRKGL
jgi:hypothetical protein